MSTWYCAQTQANLEFQARDHLERADFQTFLPTFLVKYESRNIRRKLLFRNYIFVAFDDPVYWPRVNQSPGILKVITHTLPENKQPDHLWYLMPSQINSDIIESLRQQCLAGDEIQHGGKRDKIPDEITVGCHVRILSGSLKDLSIQLPLVQWVEKDRVGLLLSMFGRSSVIEFYNKDLELVG